MKSKLIYPIAVVVFAAACGGDGGARGAKQQQASYETVQEGSAAGVTSSLNGPGETLPPITNTNADTTSAFTLNPNVAPAGQAPAAMAGAVPPSQPAYSGASSAPSYGNAPMMSSSSSNAAPSRPVYQSRETYVRTQPVQRSTDTNSSQPQQQQQQPQPVTSNEATASSGPAATPDNAAPASQTNTAPAENHQQKPQQTQQQQQQQPQQQQEPQDDNSGQSEEPPPPPPPSR
ncbi:MAG: hypothetical protein M3Q69_04315 [Acidobacteriota bacterium]|nr:hypothetical protein [Acidobacteriota bacterium]